MKGWRAYERLVALLTTKDFEGTEFTVIPNAKVTGLISNRKRQIDILIEPRYDSDLKKRVIIDAKNKKRPIDIKEVEAFEGLMRDVNASRGYLICSNGYTKAALKRPQQHIDIKLIAFTDDFNLNVGDRQSWRT